VTLDPQEAVEKWPRLGALASIPGRDGAWAIWSQGAAGEKPTGWWVRREPVKWWLVPVDASERERADQAVLLRETEFGPYMPDETDVLW
jgi:hypothetical protein